MSFPVVKDYCANFDFDVSSSVQMNGVLQKGINLSFPSFKFAGSEDGKFEMELRCLVRELHS